MRLIEKLIEWLSTHRRKPGVRERTRPLKSRWDVVLGYCMHTRVSTGEVPPGCPAVVLVHGLGVSSRYMVPTGERLAPYCHVYAPDLPGWGRSERPPHALTIGEMADVLNAWMDVFGVRFADCLAQLPHQVGHDHAVLRRGAPERIHVRVKGPGGRDDRIRRGRPVL